MEVTINTKSRITLFDRLDSNSQLQNTFPAEALLSEQRLIYAVTYMLIISKNLFAGD